MKIIWPYVMNDERGDPIDYGCVVTKDIEGDLEVLGYICLVVEPYTGYKYDAKAHPTVAHVAKMLPTNTLEEADEEIANFIKTYLEEGERVIAVLWDDDIGDGDYPYVGALIAENPADILFMDQIQTMIDVMGLPCEHRHSDADAVGVERAVQGALRNHQEFMVYRNNLL